MHMLASYLFCVGKITCILYSQLQVTKLPCVVFAPEQYENIYNATLVKANLTETDHGQGINILLHDMLDYAGDVVKLVTNSIELSWIVQYKILHA